MILKKYHTLILLWKTIFFVECVKESDKCISFVFTTETIFIFNYKIIIHDLIWLTMDDLFSLIASKINSNIEKILIFY